MVTIKSNIKHYLRQTIAKDNNIIVGSNSFSKENIDLAMEVGASQPIISKKKRAEYIDLLSAENKKALINIDFKLGSFRNVPGYRSKSAPLSKKIIALKNAPFLPPLTFLGTIDVFMNNMKKHKKVLSYLAKEFSIQIPKNLSEVNIKTTCSKKLFNELSEKLKNDDLVVLMSICGIIITDNKERAERIKTGKLEYTKDNREPVCVGDYQNFLKEVIKSFVKEKKIISILNNSVSSINNIDNQSIESGSLKNALNKISKLENLSSKLKLQIKDFIQELDDISKNLDNIYPILRSDLTAILYNELPNEKMRSNWDYMQNFEGALKNLSIQVDQFDHFSNISNESLTATKKILDEFNEKIKSLSSYGTSTIEYKKHLDQYLDKNHLSGKKEYTNSIHSKIKPSFFMDEQKILDLEYPIIFNTTFTLVEEQFKETEKFLKKKLIPLEKDRILSEYKKLGFKPKEINEVSKKINRAELDQIFPVLNEENKNLLSLQGRKTPDVPVKLSKIEKAINNTSDKVVRSLMLLKYFHDKKSINDTDLSFLNTSIQDISLANSLNIYILTELAKTINEKLGFNNEDFSLERGKYLAIMARLISASQDYDLYEFFETGLSVIPFDSHKNHKKILKLVSEGQEFEIRKTIEPKDQKLSDKAGDYFRKELNVYSHPITRDKRYGVNVVKDIPAFLSYMESKFYENILKKDLGAFELKSIRLKLIELTEEDCWEKAGTENDFRKFPTYRKDKLRTDFKKLKGSLIDIIDDKLEIHERKKMTNIFLSEDVSGYTMDVIKFIKKGPIFKQGTIINIEEKNGLSSLIQYLMNKKTVYINQPNLINYLYSFDPQDIDTLTDKIKFPSVISDEGKLENLLKSVTNDDVLNEKTLNYVKAGLGKEYNQYRSTYMERKRELQSYTSAIHKDYIGHYQDAIDNERFGLAYTLYNQSEKQQKEQIESFEEKLKSDFTEFGSRADSLQGWIRGYAPGKESDVLAEVFTEINSILLKKDKSRLDEAIDLISVLEESRGTKSVDIAYLREWLTDYEIGTSSKPVPESDEIGIRDLELMLKGVKSLPDGLEKRVQELQERKQVDDFVQTYLQLHSKVIKVDDIISRADFDLAKQLLRNAAKCFRYYSDPETEKCQELGSTGSLPILVTDSYTFLPMDRKIVMTVISDNNKKSFGKSYFQDLGAILVKELKKAKAGSPDDYLVVCFVCGGAQLLTENFKLSEFDNLLILDDFQTVGALLKESQPSVGLKHYLIRGFPLATVNPFNSERPVTDQTGVFVERGILANLTKNKDSYAIYGARRIGKTSICKDIEEKWGKKDNYICKYFSVASTECKSTEFGEVFRIGLDILDHLGVKTGSIKSQSKFSSTFSKYLSEQENNNNNVWIIIDEFDRYLMEVDKAYDKANSQNNYPFITVLRDLINQHGNFKLIICGFMNLYYKLNQEIPGLEKSMNPWKGLVASQAINVLTMEEAKSLVYKLDEELDLEFENKDLPYYIIRKTSLHPAYIQYFLRRLINMISERITQKDRIIMQEDVDGVFDEYVKGYSGDEIPFILYVDKMLRLNTDHIAMAIIAIMALDELEHYNKEDLYNKLIDWLELDKIDREVFDRRITSLQVTQVINVQQQTIEFKYQFWREYLYQLLMTGENKEFDNVINNARKEAEEFLM